MQDSNPQQKYKKKPLDIAMQIQLLRERGLIIGDEVFAHKILSDVGYYHLSSYFKGFQDREDIFEKGITMEDIWNIYTFDQNLRILLLDVLERVEKAFKAILTNKISVSLDDSHWVYEDSYFVTKPGGSYKKERSEILNNLIGDKKEKHIQNYIRKYYEPVNPPVWMVFESLSFGRALKIFRQLNSQHKKHLSKEFLLPERTLESWMYLMTALRNICAHHTRLWDKNIHHKPYINARFFKGLFNSEKWRYSEAF